MVTFLKILELLIGVAAIATIVASHALEWALPADAMMWLGLAAGFVTKRASDVVKDRKVK